MMTLQEQIENDCKILLGRALKDKVLCAFGDDGCGQFGRSCTPAFFTVKDITINLAFDELYPAASTGTVSIRLEGYNANLTGHILTDKNFEISIRKLLTDESISPEALTWGELNDQLYDQVVMNMNVQELFDC
jgi:hypothetical protein